MGDKTDTDETGNKDGLHWTEGFAIGVTIFLLVLCIVGYLVHRWCKKEYRAKREKYYPTVAQVNAHKNKPDLDKTKHNRLSSKSTANNSVQSSPRFSNNHEAEDGYWLQKKKTLDEEARKSLGLDIGFKPYDADNEHIEV